MSLSQIQDQIDANGMDDQLYALEADAKTALFKAMENHEKIWAKKAKIRWLKFGVRNSKFFHLSAKIRRNKNIIRFLKNQDRSTVEEIKRAVWELDPDSLLGPDSFPGAFFRRCWHIVEREVSNAVRYFCSSSFMPKEVNNNFLVLILKWLELLLLRLISEEQRAFQKGKLIHNNISVVSELANIKFSSTRGGGLGLQIDTKKAYDTISWNFIGWLHQIIISTKISILVNGGPHGFFGVERGLRQEDPISPMLSIIAEEVLSQGLTRLIQMNQMKPIQGSRGVDSRAYSGC
ncbi:uncharacterized protein LOC122060604 [Macadamia integrifolia]|uniref:uncharacterized protein LOC122060604 n=1 Tax=Macadamia integrifolia TaxID=60698 RepID=UPI001C527C4A|nr:uncharacterized protein LOC122060604 [Macadamia integrifolia]